MEYTKEELERAIVDLMDGCSQAHDIHGHTGLNWERCEQLSAMYGVLVEKVVFKRG